MIVVDVAITSPPPVCGDIKHIVATLARDYGETFVDFALLRQSGHALLLYGNAATGTWTIVQRGPHGGACVAASGRGFRPPVTREDS